MDSAKCPGKRGIKDCASCARRDDKGTMKPAWDKNARGCRNWVGKE